MKKRIDPSIYWIYGAALSLATALLIPYPAWAWQDNTIPAPAATVEADDNADADDNEVAPTDPFEVPDGSPQDLVKYIQEISQMRPQGAGFEAIADFRKNQATAILEASNKILESETKLEKAEIGSVIQAKISAVQNLLRSGDESAIEQIKMMPEQLKKAGYDDFVQPVESLWLNIQMSLAVRDRDVEKFNEIKAKAKKLAVEATDTIGPTVAMGVTRMAQQLAMLTDNHQLAIDTYREFGDLFIKSDDPRLNGLGKRLLGAARRLDLPGKAMELEGVTLEDKPFNLNELKGKVVLVDFWATWCGPCRAEFPNMLKAYNAYHDKGFEIVGVSVDQDHEALKEFVTEEKTPWIILVDDQPEKEDWESMADRYGIDGIPNMMLVGKDGKVIALNTRGPALLEELAKIYGPMPEPKEEASDEAAKPEATQSAS